MLSIWSVIEFRFYNLKKSETQLLKLSKGTTTIDKSQEWDLNP